MQNSRKLYPRQWYYYLKKDIRRDALLNLKSNSRRQNSISSAVDFGFTWAHTNQPQLWPDVNYATSAFYQTGAKSKYQKYRDLIL